VAAAHGVHVAHNGPDETWLIYDLGAGTTDVTLIARMRGGFRVLGNRGLPDVGGLDVDQAILDHLAVPLAERDPSTWQRLAQPTNAGDRREAMALRQDVRYAKEVLSQRSSTLIHVPLFDMDVPLGRETLDEVARPMLARTLVGVHELLRAGPTPNRAFLIGGASRMPLVATMLHQVLGLAPTGVESPEIIVAAGALYAPVPERPRPLPMPMPTRRPLRPALAPPPRVPPSPSVPPVPSPTVLWRAPKLLRGRPRLPRLRWTRPRVGRTVACALVLCLTLLGRRRQRTRRPNAPRHPDRPLGKRLR
jgi:hypothetical protein